MALDEAHYATRESFAWRAAQRAQHTDPPDWISLLHHSNRDRLCHLPREVPPRPNITQLSPQTADHDVIAALIREGGILVELFRGLCVVPEGCLRQGFTIHRYYYCDSNAACRRVARERVRALQQEFPHLLSSVAISGIFTLTQNVTIITK